MRANYFRSCRRRFPGLREAAAAALRAGRPAALAILAGVAAAAPAVAQESAAMDLATFPRATLTITHQALTHGDVRRESRGRAPRSFTFEVWVADTPARAEQGLMFVSDLPATMGMLFPLPAPRVESMWMKNTYIELDMLFIGAHGDIARIIERARPMSLDTLSSGTPVSAVLELKGGEATKLELRVGDTVGWTKTTPD